MGNMEKNLRYRYFSLNVVVTAVVLGACGLSAPDQPMPRPGGSRIERDANSTYRAHQPVVYQLERGIERLAKRAPMSELVRELPPSLDVLLDDESSVVPTKAPRGQNQNIVFGIDERSRVTNPNDFPNRAVAKIVLTYPDGIASCTGSVIGRRAVLTAGHCVHRAGVGWASSATVTPAFNSGTNPAPFGQSSAIQFFSTSGWTADHDEDYDLAVIILADELGAITGYMGLAALSDEALNSFGFDLNGYPGDLGGGQDQYHASGPVESYDGELVYYEVDSGPGQSGSGLRGVNAYTQHVFAVHSGVGTHWFEQDNQSVRLTSGWLAFIRQAILDGTPEDGRISDPFSTATFWVENHKRSDFASWLSGPGAQVVAGDFDGDGRSDIAAAGVAGWASVPVAFSNGDGTFRVSNTLLADFPAWAAQPGARLLAADFNRDGRSDLALVGAAGWGSIPVALSNGDGSFRVENRYLADFPTWASSSGVQPLAGDFNGDGFGDIALVSGPGWWTIPIAFSHVDGTFSYTNRSVADFPYWSQQTGVKAAAGDFDGDGHTDIALAGGPGWESVPVAFAQSGGNFQVSNASVPWFPGWATVPHARLLAADLDGNGLDDLALVGGSGWRSAPAAYSNGNGTFAVDNRDLGEAGVWAGEPGAVPMVGDLDADGRADLMLAMVGQGSWITLPTAISLLAGRMGGEYNNTLVGASQVTLPFVDRAYSIGYRQDVDHYSFDLSSQTYVAVVLWLTHARGDLDMQLLDAVGNVLASSTGTSDQELITRTLLPGRYVVKIYGYAGATGRYELRILR